MKLYFIRHGESVFNQKKRFQGHLPGGLSDLGKQQAKQASENIKKLDAEIIYSSDLERADQTAQIINLNHLPIVYDQRIRERHYGNYQNQIIKQSMRDELALHKDENKLFNGAETDKMIQIRLKDFLQELKTKNHKSAIIVSHNGTIVQAINAIDPNWNSKKVQNCQIIELDLDQILANI